MFGVEGYWSKDWLAGARSGHRAGGWWKAEQHVDLGQSSGRADGIYADECRDEEPHSIVEVSWLEICVLIVIIDAGFVYSLLTSRMFLILYCSIRLQTKEDLKDDDGQAKSKKSKAKSVKFSSKEGGFVMEAFQLHPLAYDLHATGALGQLDDKIHEKASLGEAHPGKSSSSSNANKKKKKKKNGHEYAEGEVGEDVISLSQPILYGGREVTSLPLSTLSRPLGVSNVAIPSSSPSFIDHTFPSLMEMESSPEILVSSQVYLRKVIKNLSEGKMLHGAEGGRVRSLWLLRALQAYLQPASFAALCEAVRSALDAEEVRLSEEVKLELQMVSEGMEEPAGDGEEL